VPAAERDRMATNTKNKIPRLVLCHLIRNSAIQKLKPNQARQN
jgi:hypothetical protein